MLSMVFSRETLARLSQWWRCSEKLVTRRIVSEKHCKYKHELYYSDDPGLNLLPRTGDGVVVLKMVILTKQGT